MPDNKLIEEILSSAAVKGPPVPIETIIETNNISLHKEYLPDDISGILDTRGKPMIVINRAHHPNRQRFSMAHEFAHFKLHKGKQIHVDKQTFYRNSKSSEGLYITDIEANQFAAELLMPEYLIRERIDSTIDWIDVDDDILVQLSEDFKVSTMAMSIRLQRLELIT